MKLKNVLLFLAAVTLLAAGNAAAQNAQAETASKDASACLLYTSPSPRDS